MITYQLECTLRLNVEKIKEDIAVDVIKINIPSDLSDEETKIFFDEVRENMKRKYQNVINTYFEVILKQSK